MRSQKKFSLYKSRKSRQLRKLRKSRKSRNKKRIRKYKLYGGGIIELNKKNFVLNDFEIENSNLLFKKKKITEIQPVVKVQGTDRGMEVYKSGNFSTDDELNELLGELIHGLNYNNFSSITVTYED